MKLMKLLFAAAGFYYFFGGKPADKAAAKATVDYAKYNYQPTEQTVKKSKKADAEEEKLLSPLHCAYHVSSPYGYRTNPVSGTYKKHEGIDLACDEGSPIFASADGKITSRTYDSTYGNYIIITHKNGIKTMYAHMETFGSYNCGDYVKANQIIGYAGTTGQSTGPHCHFEIIKNGCAIDPDTMITF